MHPEAALTEHENMANEGQSEYTPTGLSITDLSDSEKLDEILYWMRVTGQALQQFQQLGPSGIMKMMMTGK